MRPFRPDLLVLSPRRIARTDEKRGTTKTLRARRGCNGKRGEPGRNVRKMCVRKMTRRHAASTAVAR
jgi:hypothetical protein